MYPDVTPYIQPYAISYVRNVLHQVSCPLRIVSRLGEKETIVYDHVPDEASKRAIPVVYINHPNFWLRVCSDFDLGFAEAYMLQEVDCDDLDKIFDLYLDNPATFGSGNQWLQIVHRIARFWRPRNDIKGARLNISSHYDTSNELFSKFLSPDMNYSCPHWSGDPRDSLHSAQRRKVHSVLRKARIQPNHHLLDIGCGWGDLMMEAVKSTGCKATGLTLSVAQKTLAEERIRAAGLQDSIQILLCDYRHAPRPENGYDRIVSIGMFEHVGAEYLDGYFEAISRLLNPDHGIVVVDGITKIHPFHEADPWGGDYMHRYVFPGGYLPTIQILLTSLHRGSVGTLEVSSVQDTGPHYGKTLAVWRDNFLANWDGIRRDFCANHPDASEVEIEAYRRRWLYYFIYCEAGFRGRILGNYQICAVRTPEARVDYSTMPSPS